MQFARHRQRVPQVWGLLAAYFELEAPLSRAWWGALERARWSEARELRQTLAFFDTQEAAGVDVILRFFQHRVTPQAIVDVLEALVGERLLSRQKATLLEEAVLRRVTRGGQWQ
jgi:hypothetical protein